MSVLCSFVYLHHENTTIFFDVVHIKYFWSSFITWAYTIPSINSFSEVSLVMIDMRVSFVLLYIVISSDIEHEVELPQSMVCLASIP